MIVIFTWCIPQFETASKEMSDVRALVSFLFDTRRNASLSTVSTRECQRVGSDVDWAFYAVTVREEDRIEGVGFAFGCFRKLTFYGGRRATGITRRPSRRWTTRLLDDVEFSFERGFIGGVVRFEL